MNFKRFLTEDLNQENIIELIKQDCSQFLKESKQYYLYRGIPNQTDEFIKLVPRIDRKPKNSRPEMQEDFNAAFEKLYGESNIRAKAVFSTGSEMDTQFYAKGKEPYIIFPVDGYTYWWSPHISDIFVEFKDFLYANDYAKDILKDEYPDGSMEEFVESGEYTNKNLVDGFRSRSEIMLICTEYYGIRVNTKIDLDELWHKI